MQTKSLPGGGHQVLMEMTHVLFWIGCTGKWWWETQRYIISGVENLPGDIYSPSDWNNAMFPSFMEIKISEVSYPCKMSGAIYHPSGAKLKGNITELPIVMPVMNLRWDVCKAPPLLCQDSCWLAQNTADLCTQTSPELYLHRKHRLCFRLPLSFWDGPFQNLLQTWAWMATFAPVSHGPEDCAIPLQTHCF